MNQSFDLSHAVAARSLWSHTPLTSLRVFETLVLEMRRLLWDLAQSAPHVINCFSDWKIDDTHDCDDVNFVTPYVVGYQNVIIQLPLFLPSDAALLRVKRARMIFRNRRQLFKVKQLRRKNVAFCFLCDRHCGFTLGIRAQPFTLSDIASGIRATLKNYCPPLGDKPISWLPRAFASEIYDDIRAESARYG